MSSSNASSTEPNATSEESSEVISMTALIQSRHSTRAFFPSKPVPTSILEECFELARNSPSSTNHQPWRVYIMSGERLERTRHALVDAVTSGVRSTTPAAPQQFNRFRSDLGHELYGVHGYNIARGDRDGMEKARLRNYEFFDAPTVAAICIPSSLAEKGFLAETMSVGLYLQTLVYLLAERGIGTCMQVAPAGYGDVVEKGMGIEGEEVEIICTLAIGYEDPSKQINSVRAKREEWKENVKFLD